MDFIFVLTYLLFLAITYSLLKMTGFSFFRVGLSQFVILSLIIFSFIGTLPLYFGWNEYRFNAGVSNRNLVFQVMMFSGSSIIILFLGVVFAKSLFKKSAVLNNYDRLFINRNEIWLLLILTALVLVVLYSYLIKVPRIALLVAIFDSVSDSYIARSFMGNAFPGKYHWYSLIMHDLANIVSFSFFAFYLANSKKIYLITFAMVFSISSFAAVMTTEKGPMAWLLIGHFIVYIMIRKKGVFPVREIILLFVLLLTLLVFLYVFFMGVTDPFRAVLNIFSRAFGGSIQPAYHYLEIFPEKKEFLLGLSFPNPGGVFPHQPYALATEVSSWVKPGLAKEGIVGSMPTVFWGEAYANFSYIGLVFIPFIIGFLLFSIDIIASKLIDTPFKIGFYVWLLLHFKNLSVSGFSGYIIDSDLIALSFIFITGTALSNGMKIKVKGRLI